jgi:hypothetical protein
MAKKTTPKSKKVKAPKGAELKLESPSRLRAKNLKASWDNTMMDSPAANYASTFDEFMRKKKVDNASKLGRNYVEKKKK